MNAKSLAIVGAVALTALITASDSFAQQRTSTLTTRRGGAVTTTVDRDRSDGSIGRQRTVTAPDGRVSTASRSTAAHDGTVIHERNRTGLNGQTASREDVYSKGHSAHSRTGRYGRSRSWSRDW